MLARHEGTGIIYIVNNRYVCTDYGSDIPVSEL